MAKARLIVEILLDVSEELNDGFVLDDVESLVEYMIAYSNLEPYEFLSVSISASELITKEDEDDYEGLL